MYEQYTDKQIVEMLKPKLTKIIDGMDGILDAALEHSESGRNLIKLIATIYRSAYIRGQLGRNFIIGEKKDKELVSPFKVGDKVKFLDFSFENESLVGSQLYPPVNTIGEVVGVLSPEFCFVQWPKGVTYSNGALFCPYSFLAKVTDEKVTEPWVPATKDNVKIGSKIRMINGKLHNENPRWFPVVGTVGIVRNLCDINCDVQWPKGTTSWQDKWWCNYEHLEVLLCE